MKYVHFPSANKTNLYRFNDYVVGGCVVRRLNESRYLLLARSVCHLTTWLDV